ncbi:unnamed protein product, partial [Allacma fusca]
AVFGADIFEVKNSTSSSSEQMMQLLPPILSSSQYFKVRFGFSCGNSVQCKIFHLRQVLPFRFKGVPNGVIGFSDTLRRFAITLFEQSAYEPQDMGEVNVGGLSYDKTNQIAKCRGFGLYVVNKIFIHCEVIVFVSYYNDKNGTSGPN